MTGLEIIKATTDTAGGIADIISKPCPPVVPAKCDPFSCRECWLAWLTTGAPPKEKGPSDERTTPGEEAGSDTLTEEEQVLQDLFRQEYNQGTRNATFVSALATFGRLLEKERHLPATSEAAALERLSSGLYNGSISFRVESGDDGTVIVQFIDTIRRANAGRAVLKRMGTACYVKSVDFTLPR